ncbi:hypothetical protein NLU13_8963 [Sarocladium strictum]|uniref:Uncharacterized protein n=1 Tax=Sarocladium strictum TaxID=5046 RepID=A0AA39G996_SARSR|nr:hypothetical protein NLU13_8963 [Sarocladium strictum]
MPSLLDLPPEILQLIASNFNVLEARKPLLRKTSYSITEFGPENRRSDRGSLSALSATCRRLRACIQPALYRCAYPYNAQVEFARTLESRPDLAAAVRELYYASGTYWNTNTSPIFPLPTKHALGFQRPRTRNATNFNELMAEQPGEISQDDMQEDEHGYLVNSRGVYYQTDGVPNAYSWKHPALEKRLLANVLRLVPNLQRLSVWYEIGDGGSIVPLGTLKDMQELRIYNREPSSLGKDSIFTDLIAHMPSLRRLEYHFLRGYPDGTHNSVQELILSNCALSNDDFCTISSGFPNLRKLSYIFNYFDTSNCASARGIFQALLKRRETITDLTVRLNGDVTQGYRLRYGDDGWGPTDRWHLPPHIDERQFDPCCISRFHKLEDLAIDVDTLEDLCYGGFGESFSRDLLAELLPPSLRRVRIELGVAVGDMLDTIERWIPVCRRTCPDLRSVSLTNFARNEDRVSELVERFKAVDIAACHSQEKSPESTLVDNHRLGPEPPLDSYDGWPGWPFWDPDAEPMPLVPTAYLPGSGLERLAEQVWFGQHDV